ncbi:hypothetical protein [Streptomyces rochei]|uniref:hypothetical protein n=1 Tax=Streptomyces rochei TaxID=1928 RepID=UPI00403929B4
MTNQTTADAREHLRLLALSLATGSALVEPSAFDAAIDAHQAAVLREAADAAERVATLRHRQHEIEREQGALDVMTQLCRMADETATTETQAECTASRTGACLREAESETACDTEAGECAHGGHPAAGARP